MSSAMWLGLTVVSAKRLSSEDQLGEVVEEERSFKLESVHVGGFKLDSNRKRTAWKKEKQRLTTMQCNSESSIKLYQTTYCITSEKDLEGKIEEISKPVYNYDKVDKVIFAVNSSFLAAGFSLVDGGARILLDKPPTNGEVIRIDGCNDPEDAYAFVYTKTDNDSKKIVSVYCILMNNRRRL
ncbi:hypothetical protein ZIOFF_070912 [Zingiber officinale]|uniref:Uncharacterized protein n=1 Tax=Zingiber officinale TaxID=94328 RepID=A0A8J5C0V7_ZINOF|nr:hypothetical protein ZIOFF_070912 [Zingiber officinale]